MRQRGILVRPGAVGISGLLLPFLLTACSATPTGSTDRLGTPAPSLPRATAAATATGGASSAPVPDGGTEGLAGGDALTTYQYWWKVQIDVLGRSDSDGNALRQYATSAALSETLLSVTRLHDAKLVMIGAPRTSPIVKSLDLQANPPTATIDDCVDVSDWHQADADTKQIKDPQQRLSRYPATAVLKKYGNRWLIADFTREVTKTC
ncbi:hypothetical protein [Streptomyces sp. TLI_171]|uniref:hypothetical protein n=1 Tax=Streptomyces sp. TLI_171 TaxID=1938859 RepID=UPI000C4C6E76|nr:hypothetical protein [Streptomyces sp. TLI_171]RKE22578.1 hypothetical protein BX266_6024 [Streptomyces sp. TLI_171]